MASTRNACFRGQNSRGLIEARAWRNISASSLLASAAKTAAASLKLLDPDQGRGLRALFRGQNSRGLIEASPKRALRTVWPNFRGQNSRGLIEARHSETLHGGTETSAAKTAAASLKLAEATASSSIQFHSSAAKTAAASLKHAAKDGCATANGPAFRGQNSRGLIEAGFEHGLLALPPYSSAAKTAAASLKRVRRAIPLALSRQPSAAKTAAASLKPFDSEKNVYQIDMLPRPKQPRPH